jgi:hypothetical protein
MSVNLDTVSEKNDFFDRFKMMMEQAEDELLMIGGLTPHEYYFLNCNPVIAGTEDGQNNHYVFLQAEIRDDLDREVCRVILGDCEIEGDGRVDIKVSCYRKKWRDRLVRYLEGLGVSAKKHLEQSNILVLLWCYFCPHYPHLLNVLK